MPLLLCVGIFFWGLKGWMEYSVAPGEAMEIQITRPEMAVGVRIPGRHPARSTIPHLPGQ